MKYHGMKSCLKCVPPIALLMLFLCHCGKPSPDGIIYGPSDKIDTDSTIQWLEVHSNFHDTNYYSVFGTYYENKLNRKQYGEAASALNVVVNQEIYFLFFDSAFQITLQAFDTLYADQLPWHKTLFVEEYKGYRLMDQGEFRKAIAIFRKAAAHQPFDYDTYIDLANLFNDMAFCYSAIGEQEQALRCNHQALLYFSHTENTSGKGGTYDNIALVHLFTKNYAEAEVYFDKAMHSYQETGDTGNMFITLHNRILLYQETNDPRKFELIDSTYHFFKSSSIEDPSLEVALSNFYVDKLLNEGKISEAKTVLNNMKLITEKLQSPSADDDYLISLAQYELKSKKGILNKKLIENALRAAEESEHFQNQLAFCEVLKKDALLHGNYREALEYSEKEKIAANNLANQEMVAKTMELDKRHETEKKEQHIALQAESILNKNITIALLLVTLLTFGLVVALIYYRQKQKKNRAESRRAFLFTRQLLAKTEEERKRIAGDLHDSVSHELLILKNTIQKNDSTAGSKIDDIINDIRIISRNLHPIMFEKVGLAASIDQLVERAQSMHNLMVTADIDYEASFLSTSDELQVYRILQEALSNTIKYAEAFAAKITLFSKNDVLYIQIKDNGKGFDVTEKISGSTAFGLHNILERSKAIGGVAKIHADKNGTVITIEIKKRHEYIDS
jgi:two-component system NarL family sensor kinase